MAGRRRLPDPEVIFALGYSPTFYLENEYEDVLDNLTTVWINNHGLRAKNKDNNTAAKVPAQRVYNFTYPDELQNKIDLYFTRLYGDTGHKNEHLNSQIMKNAPHLHGLHWSKYAETSIGLFENYGIHSLLPHLHQSLHFLESTEEFAEKYGPNWRGVRLDELESKLDEYADGYGAEMQMQLLEFGPDLFLREVSMPFTHQFAPARKLSRYTHVRVDGAQGTLPIGPDSTVNLWCSYPVIDFL